MNSIYKAKGEKIHFGKKASGDRLSHICLYMQHHLNSLNNCCCSVAQSCLTLCDPMDCSTPGFPVLHYFPEVAQTHVHRVSDAIQPSRPLSHLLLLPSLFPSIRIFSKECVLRIRCPSIESSASASVLPMNIQD